MRRHGLVSWNIRMAVFMKALLKMMSEVDMEFFKNPLGTELMATGKMIPLQVMG